MAYLQPNEYEAYGLTADTSEDWITTASALMDAYCRRTTLNPAQYVERLRVTAGSQTVRLSYLPLVTVSPAKSPLVGIRGRLVSARRGEWPRTEQETIAQVFALPGSWSTVDVNSVDLYVEAGEITLAQHVLGLPYNEVEVTYTAGLAELPDAVKVACALIVKTMQATPALNVKSSRMDTMQMEYFSSSLIDEQVSLLLKPYVAERVG